MKLFQKVVRGLLLLVLFFPYAKTCIGARDYNGGMGLQLSLFIYHLSNMGIYHLLSIYPA